MNRLLTAFVFAPNSIFLRISLFFFNFRIRIFLMPLFGISRRIADGYKPLKAMDFPLLLLRWISFLTTTLKIADPKNQTGPSKSKGFCSRFQPPSRTLEIIKIANRISKASCMACRSTGLAEPMIISPQKPLTLQAKT
jgi:hypothetical protein